MQESLMTDAESIQTIAKEIEEAVVDNNLNRATTRLIDFTRDYSSDKKHYNTALIYRKEFLELKEEVRTYNKTDETRRHSKKLAASILDFKDEIVELLNDGPDVPHGDQTAVGVDPVQELVNDTPADGAVINAGATGDHQDTPEETPDPIEARKKAFKQKREAAQQVSSLPSRIIVQARNIDKSFKVNKKFHMKNISLSLSFGEITGVVGENGNGKTTLLRIIAGELAADKGELTYPFLEPADKDWLRIKRHIAYMPQQLKKWTGSLKENLHYTASINNIRGEKNEDEVEYIIYRLGLEDYLNLRWNEISGGYQTRFELARLLIGNPKLLILDEPLANLDINAQMIFLNDLKDMAASRKHPMAILISSQHLHEVESIADTIMFIEDGHIKYYGSFEDLGADRTYNSFEIAGTYARQKLTKNRLFTLLHEMTIEDVEDNCLSLIIHTSKDVHYKDILNHMLRIPELEITYFRDISKSTKTLFRREC